MKTEHFPEQSPRKTPLIDPKNDYVFKRIFAGSPHLLAALINAVRWPAPPVVELEVINPEILPEDLHGKFIVLDILAKDAAGQRYNVEMQVRTYDHWGARSAYYLARIFSDQMVKGQDYRGLKPALGIHLLDFNLYPADEHADKFHWHFEMRDRERPDVCLGEELGLHLIELPKADAWAMRVAGDEGSHALSGQLSAQLKDWVRFLKHSQEEGVMSQVDDLYVEEALLKLLALSEDPKARAVAATRYRALLDERTQTRAAHERGLVEGRAELVERLLTRRFGALQPEVIARLHAADVAQLDTWAERVLDAGTLQDVLHIKV